MAAGRLLSAMCARTMRLFSCSQLMEDFAWQASWGMGGAYEISEFRQILQTTHVGCYLQPLKMALLDDICRFLNFQRHRGDMTRVINYLVDI